MAPNHWIVAPVIVPLLAGALCMLLPARAPRVAAGVSLAATIAFAATAVRLLGQARDGGVEIYLLGNWQAPFGIALALDRLAALMLTLTALVALLGVTYALAGDDRRGRHFHALFQFQLMGLAGAFLTADLFNLFVFFEVLLCASYGLLLHGEGTGRRERLKATVHYLIFNLAGSALFLIAVALLYGVTGTLNMADMAVRLAALPEERAALAQTAALMLLVVFAVKAALLPLYFWLPDAYASATAPVAALFAIMTKVGVYGIARTTTLLFGMNGDELNSVVSGVFVPALPLLALATLVLAALGILAARRLRGLIAYLVVASAGTLLLAIGIATPAALGAGLFYLVHSTLVASVWFLIADRVSAERPCGDDLQARAAMPTQSWAPLGMAFALVAIGGVGMPPLAGFLGKSMLLSAARESALAGWVFAGVLASSFGILVALARAGSAIFWRHGDEELGDPKIGDRPRFPDAATNRGQTTFSPATNRGQTTFSPGRISHCPRSRETVVCPRFVPRSVPDLSGVSIAVGLVLVVGVAVFAGPISSYARATAQQLLDRRGYIDAVLGAKAMPALYDVRREMRERGEAK